MGFLARVLSPALLVVAAALPVTAQEAALPAGKLTVELNKLEEDGSGGCRAFFLFRNETGLGIEGFQMSLAIFRADGVIDRLLSIDASPLPVARTTLKLFQIPEIGCADISEVLLHDIPLCQPQNEEPRDCYPLLALDSRTAARLTQ